MVRSIKAVFVIVAFLRALEGPLHLTYMAAALVLDSPSATVCVAAVRVWPAGAARARVCKACTARSRLQSPDARPSQDLDPSCCLRGASLERPRAGSRADRAQAAAWFINMLSFREQVSRFLHSLSSCMLGCARERSTPGDGLAGVRTIGRGRPRHGPQLFARHAQAHDVALLHIGQHEVHEVVKAAQQACPRARRWSGPGAPQPSMPAACTVRHGAGRRCSRGRLAPEGDRMESLHPACVSGTANTPSCKQLGACNPGAESHWRVPRMQPGGKSGAGSRRMAMAHALHTPV